MKITAQIMRDFIGKYFHLSTSTANFKDGLAEFLALRLDQMQEAKGKLAIISQERENEIVQHEARLRMIDEEIEKLERMMLG